MKKVLVVGHMGNMGRRYCAILNHLNISWIGHDLILPMPVSEQATKFDGIIIATPTDSHISLLRYWALKGSPMLCEKPIGKLASKVIDLCADFRKGKINLQMVNQYEFMPQVEVNALNWGDSFYNYWNHGNDGLAWDCINIIGLARRRPGLRSSSPVWHCAINGNYLNISDMDNAYIKMINTWTKNPQQNLGYIEKSHAKTEKWLEAL